ncbi:MAG: hypothetical protein JNN32_10615, partial [Flavobacteriales bacterium]|nr:hypothetical protein [Flavobacteriales bacterium]
MERLLVLDAASESLTWLPLELIRKVPMSPNKPAQAEVGMTLDEVREEILRDYRIVFESREASLLGRKEVLTGKAKFGIFGDGKELAQVCMAKQFRHGDWRSGYYRDMTFMFAIGELTVQQWFA